MLTLLCCLKIFSSFPNTSRQTIQQKAPFSWYNCALLFFDLTSFLVFKNYLCLYCSKAISSQLLLSIYISSLHLLQLIPFSYLSTEIALSKVINEFLYPKYNIHFNFLISLKASLLFCTRNSFLFFVSFSYKGRIRLGVWHFVHTSKIKHCNDTHVLYTTFRVDLMTSTKGSVSHISNIRLLNNSNMKTIVYFYLTVVAVILVGKIYHIMQMHSRITNQTLNLLPSNEMSTTGLHSLGQLDDIVAW